MNNIYDNIEELFDIYKLRFGVPFCAEKNLRKDFDRMMLLKPDYMPHWFVLELISGNYDISEDDELI